MNYWIFVVVGNNAEEIFSQLLVLKNWGFWKTKPTRKKIEALRKGDKIIFYIGGAKDRYYLAGEARLISDLTKPNRESLNFPERGPLDGLVYFDNIDLWNGKKLYLTELVREKLNFIKNKKKWGIAFRQSLVSICERDYNEIRQLIA